jgi:hypothetical protein
MFTLLASQFVFRFGGGFQSFPGLPGMAKATATATDEPNVNTSEKDRTEKGERK